MKVETADRHVQKPNRCSRSVNSDPVYDLNVSSDRGHLAVTNKNYIE